MNTRHLCTYIGDQVAKLPTPNVPRSHSLGSLFLSLPRNLQIPWKKVSLLNVTLYKTFSNLVDPKHYLDQAEDAGPSKQTQCSTLMK